MEQTICSSILVSEYEIAFYSGSIKIRWVIHSNNDFEYVEMSAPSEIRLPTIIHAVPWTIY